jgi:hypothetical protein
MLNFLNELLVNRIALATLNPVGHQSTKCTVFIALICAIAKLTSFKEKWKLVVHHPVKSKKKQNK